MIERIKKYMYYKFLSLLKPEIFGVKDTNAKKIKNTRISNFTHVSNENNLILGENVFIGHYNYIDCFKKITIENGCQITNFVSILTHSSHNAIRIYGENYINEIKNLEKDVLKQGDVYIGDYTYVGAHSTIMPGSKLGKGCIVGAYSYVNGVFPDYSILRGQPAKIIGNTKSLDKKILEKFKSLNKFYYD